METQKQETSINFEGGRKGIVSSSLHGERARLEFTINECDPLSEKEFRMMLILVATAIGVFGSIVNGWLV
jgi:hypothetical protein